jgi:trans-aconitate methyltransferase
MSMQQTPMHDNVNHMLLGLVPGDVERVVEVGCSSGALGAAFLREHPEVEYIGIELVEEYAERARARLSEVVVGNIEHFEDRTFEVLHPTDCWIFGDVLEHLYDPWRTLKRVRESLGERGCVVACIPNVQHWSLQAQLNAGEFHYADSGLLDRTHIRFFTRKTIIELFNGCGYEIEEMGANVIEGHPAGAAGIAGVRAHAGAVGTDPEEAVRDASAFQYLVRARRR